MRLTLILAVLCLGFASCEKNYVCECTGTDGAVKKSFEVNEWKKNMAKDKCVTYQNNINTSIALGYTCVIK
ncbi:MAG: hypothetical protein EOP51_05280 [Sphingobacteriales bacterium]|nr:MAG: hypothetical protein EOP51_05280 [Sphingobacteriales bacterium]